MTATDQVSVALGDGAEAIRAANHAARDASVELVGLYAALGSVVTLVDRLPQVVLFTQRCAITPGTGDLFDDSGRDPGERLVEVVAVLGEAHTQLISVGRALGRAHAALSHLSQRPQSISKATETRSG